MRSGWRLGIASLPSPLSRGAAARARTSDGRPSGRCDDTRLTSLQCRASCACLGMNRVGRWGNRGVRRRSSFGFSRRMPTARDGLLCSLVGERERGRERGREKENSASFAHAAGSSTCQHDPTFANRDSSETAPFFPSLV